MSVNPWLPGGASELPAERIVLFADNDNIIQQIKETSTDKDGTAFTARWESGTLNREGTGYAFTLNHMLIFYTALEATTLTLKISGDGGNNWTSYTVTVTSTTNEIKVASVGTMITGADVRVRFEFDTTVLVNIFGFIPTLVRRGMLDVAGV